MKRVTFFVFLMALTIAVTLPVASQKSDFSGTWKLDKQKSVLTEFSPTLVKISVAFKGDSLLTERVYDIGDGQEYPFIENVALDGQESKITIYDMPRKAKAVWSEQDNVVNLESTTTFYGSNGSEDFISRETWKVDKASNTLTISFRNKGSGGESEGYFTFTGTDQQ
jgi:hypothetical protein